MISYRDHIYGKRLAGSVGLNIGWCMGEMLDMWRQCSYIDANVRRARYACNTKNDRCTFQN